MQSLMVKSPADYMVLTTLLQVLREGSSIFRRQRQTGGNAQVLWWNFCWACSPVLASDPNRGERQQSR